MGRLLQSKSHMDGMHLEVDVGSLSSAITIQSAGATHHKERRRDVAPLQTASSPRHGNTALRRPVPVNEHASIADIKLPLTLDRLHRFVPTYHRRSPTAEILRCACTCPGRCLGASTLGRLNDTHFAAGPPASRSTSLTIFRHTTFESLFHVSRMDPASQTHCVLLLDLPPSALGGIDLLSFTVTPRFKGVKSLPPGLHFVFAASDSSLSARHGAWFYVSPGAGPPQVFIKKWNPQTEDLVAETSQTELFKWRANLGAIWKDSLTPYRQTAQYGDTTEDENVVEESSDWNRLTSRISQSLLSRICGLNPDHWSLTSASSAAQDLEDIPGLESSNSVLHPDKELRFLPIDLKQTWPTGATGRERTEAAQDRSWALGDLIESYGLSDDSRSRDFEILGELQFCFLMVLTLNNNSCLEQWKRLLGLLLTCRTAVKERYHLFLELLKTLRLQLSHCGDMEAGMFDLNEQGGGFLKPLLRRFRKGLDEFDGKRKIDMVDEFDELQDFLQKEFGWQLDDSYVKRGLLELEDGELVEMDMNGADEDDETGDYAPTIVDLTPAQLKELNDTHIYKRNGGLKDDSDEEADLDEMDTRY